MNVEGQGPGTIRVQLNGAPKELPSGSSVAALLERLGLPRERVAVEVDGEIVRKAAYDATQLQAGATIEVVSFVGGG